MEIELEQKKMESIRELANVSMKISEAKNLLFKLQEEETDYLVSREKKALEKVNKILEDSRDLLDKTHQNYEEIHKFCQTITEYADFLSETYEKLQGLIQIFNKKNEIWEENAKRQNIELSTQRKLIENDAKTVEERKKRMDEERESIKKEREHLESQQVALAGVYKLEKDLWEKTH